LFLTYSKESLSTPISFVEKLKQQAERETEKIQQQNEEIDVKITKRYVK
jgi:hypothetical protein